MKIRIVVFFIIFTVSASKALCNSANLSAVLEKLSFTNPYCVFVKEIGSDQMLFRSDVSNIGSQPIPLGSVIKIFSIIAKYKNRPVDAGETYFCPGYDQDTPSVSKCWLKKGHGQISLLNAIAQSCNTYFYHFVREVDFPLFIQTLRERGILRNSDNWGRSVLNRDDQLRAMVGKLNIIRIKPLDLMDSCDKLFGRASGLPIEVTEVLTEGMSLCYRNGTASVMRKKLGMPEDLPVICKTGTGMFEEDGEVYYYKTSGIFVGVYESNYLVLAVAKETTGADKASLLGLSLIKALSMKKIGGKK